jgi:hypothetical protein
VRRVLGIAFFVIGLILLVIGVLAMTTDTYDTSRTGHVIVGAFWAIPGLALAAGGLRLILRRDSG